MRPSALLLGTVFFGGYCVMQKLAAVKMAIRTECETQKEAAIEAGIDQGQLARKLNHQEAFTFDNLDALPEEVQRTALLEMLSQMGLPERAKRWLRVARDFDSLDNRRSA